MTTRVPPASSPQAFRETFLALVEDSLQAHFRLHGEYLTGLIVERRLAEAEDPRERRRPEVRDSSDTRSVGGRGRLVGRLIFSGTRDDQSHGAGQQEPRFVEAIVAVAAAERPEENGRRVEVSSPRAPGRHEAEKGAAPWLWVPRSWRISAPFSNVPGKTPPPAPCAPTPAPGQR